MRISYWPNLKSVAQIIFKIFGIVCHKFLKVTWLRPRPFWGKLLARPLGLSKRKLSTKFEDSSWSNFEDMFDCMPKSLGVTWPRPRPFRTIIIWAPARLSHMKRCTKFDVSSSGSFEDMLDCMPKIEGSRDLGHAPFGENYWRAHSAFPIESCVLNLKSLAEVVLTIGSIICQKF